MQALEHALPLAWSSENLAVEARSGTPTKTACNHAGFKGGFGLRVGSGNYVEAVCGWVCDRRDVVPKTSKPVPNPFSSLGKRVWACCEYREAVRIILVS